MSIERYSALMELLEGSVQDNTPVLSLGFSIPAPIGAELKQSDGNTNSPGCSDTTDTQSNCATLGGTETDPSSLDSLSNSLVNISSSPVDPDDICPANLDPRDGIVLVSDAVARATRSQPRHWYPGDELPVFKSLTWTDLERLFDIFNSKVEDADLMPADIAPSPLIAFQERLRGFYRSKSKQIQSQIEAIPAHRARIALLSDEEREEFALQSWRQQKVEDRLTVGDAPAVALGALKE